MLKRLKTVSMMLFLMGASTGAAFAVTSTGADDVKITQQSETATGVVKDALGETVIGASVIVKGTTNGTITDFDGNFSLAGVKKGDIIQISFVGYVTQEVAWNGTPLNVVLNDDTQALEEVVVVGFGTQKKVNLTGAVSTVDSKAISARPVNSVTDALQGAVAGLNLSTPSSGGMLNSTKSLNIRGTGTIDQGSSVNPLILIDGMEGDMNALNPQDIENISVLKDASAASIYGSRAAGGVILITTKGGKEGKATINYNNSFRFNSPLNMPEMMDSYTWAQYMTLAARNNGESFYSDAKLTAIQEAMKDPSKPTMFRNSGGRWEVWDVLDLLPVGNTDWLKEHFGNSFSQEHTMSVNGGSEKIKYYFSANFLDQDGVLRHGDDNKQRYTVTGKINASLTDWMQMTYTTRFSRTDFQTPTIMSSGTDEFYFNACRYWPTIPTTDPNGHYVPESYIERLENGGIYRTQSDVLSQQLALRITPLEGWVINAELNYRINNDNNHNENITTYGYNADNVPFVDYYSNSWVQEYNYKSNYFNPNIFTEYSFSLKEDHNFKVMAGFQSEWLRDRSITANQYGINAGLPTLNTTSSNPKVSGGYASWATAGFFGRLNYDYKGRYLFEANIRYDGSSRFLSENRWSVFPSFSAGWNIAHEAFFEDYTDYVNTLKLRASWGELGNQNTNNWYPFYPTIGYYTGSNGWLVNNKKPNYATQPSMVSSTLTWEKNRTWEIGLDWGAFNNRLTGSFGYYQRNTYDMVGDGAELPDVLGITEPKVNNLEMTSKGWDLQISWRDQINDFRYGASLTLSDNTVTIDQYPNDSKNLGKYYAGAKIGDIWGYTTVGIANSQQEMDNHLAQANQSALGSNWTAGDIMYADLNGDKKVDTGEYTLDNHGDLTIIGNSTPRYNFGLNLDAAWKGFDLKVFFQGTLKRDYWPGNSETFWGAMGTGKWWALGFTYHSDYWSPENTDAYYPAPNWGAGRNMKTQTRYLQNAAYCRLKNITLGYTLPKNITEKFYVQNLRVFASAENLFTITNFTEAGDPELIGAGYGGKIGVTYPLSKTVSVGLSVTF